MANTRRNKQPENEIVVLTKQEIGRRLAEARELGQLSQEELAGQSEYSRQFISLVERGLSSPGVDALQAMVALCGMSLADFFRSSVPDKYESRAQRRAHEDLQTILEAGGVNAKAIPGMLSGMAEVTKTQRRRGNG